MKRSHTCLRILAWLSLASLPTWAETSPPLTCSVIEEGQDPGLQEIKFDLGDGEETFLAYVQPDVTSFYRSRDPPASTAVVPKDAGLAGKFINLSNRPLRLYWESYDGGPTSLISLIGPFQADGTATRPGHVFFFVDPENSNEELIRFVVEGCPENVYVYDPYHVPGDEEATQNNLATLTNDELTMYNLLRRTVRFNEEYIKFTGRSYLVNYPRPRPSHFMWRAEYFEQTHWVTSRETQFVRLPPPEALEPITSYGKARILKDDEPRLLSEYRTDEPVMNMTLTVMSCSPRVFEIPNFLSQVEVDHILELAAHEELSLSGTGNLHESGIQPDELNEDDISLSRTSYNSWLPREKSPILDAVYRRAADLMRIDEALLRHRGDGEHSDLGNNRTIAESLQLVHYDVGQEYTAHHDFGFAPVDSPRQQERFATLLLYLNEGMVGGATEFPRWLNAETFEGLRAVPNVGKAVLFYSQLPDGNMDDLSYHAAKPVYSGEKWLVNLWVWDPVYEDDEDDDIEL